MVCSSLHLFYKSFPNKINVQLEYLRGPGRLVTWQCRTGDWFGAAGGQWDDCHHLPGFGSPRFPSRHHKGNTKAAVPTRALAAVLISGRKISVFIYLCIF